jgi:hypothetical protein
MPEKELWETTCRVCGSPVYYEEFSGPIELGKEEKQVYCTCTGEKDEEGEKHTLPYFFPKDFTKVKLNEKKWKL